MTMCDFVSHNLRVSVLPFFVSRHLFIITAVLISERSLGYNSNWYPNEKKNSKL